jgi:hypothetical protein
MNVLLESDMQDIFVRWTSLKPWLAGGNLSSSIKHTHDSSARLGLDTGLSWSKLENIIAREVVYYTHA